MCKLIFGNGIFMSRCSYTQESGVNLYAETPSRAVGIFATPYAHLFLNTAIWGVFLAVNMFALVESGDRDKSGKITNEITSLEIGVFVYSIGLTLKEFGEIWTNPFYFRSVWNAVDIIMVLIFLSFMMLRIFDVTICNSSNCYAETSHILLSLTAIFYWTRIMPLLKFSELLGPHVGLIAKMIKPVFLFVIPIGLFVAGLGMSLRYLVPSQFPDTRGIIYYLVGALFGNFELEFEFDGEGKTRP